MLRDCELPLLIVQTRGTEEQIDYLMSSKAFNILLLRIILHSLLCALLLAFYVIRGIHRVGDTVSSNRHHTK